MNQFDDSEGCPSCGFWQCGGCGEYDPRQVELEKLYDDLDKEIDEENPA